MTDGGAWPPGCGEMAKRVREHDWAATPLGPIESWPQSLRTAVDLILETPAGMNIDLDARERAEAALQESEPRNAFLVRFSDAVRGLSDPALVARESCRILSEQLGTDRTAWAVLDWEAREYVADWSFPGNGSPVEASRWPFDEREAFSTEHLAGRPVVYDDIGSNPLIPDALKAQMRERGLLAGIAVPVLAAGKLAAVLNTSQASAPRRWTAGEISFVEALAQRAWAEIERARAEAALRESETRFRSLFETMGQGYSLNEVVRDADGRAIDIRYIEHNPALERLTGVPASEANGRLASEVFPGLDRFWVDIVDRVVTSGTTEQVEHELTPIGRWYQSTFYPVGGDRCVSLFDDITERKRAEAALRESEQRQAFLLKLSDALRAERDPGAVGQLAVEMVAEHMGVDRCYVAHASPEGHGRVDPQFHAPGLAPMPPEYALDAEFPEAMRQLDSKTLIIRDLWNDPDLSEQDKKSISALGMESLLVAALRRGQRFFWGLAVAKTSPRAWTDADRMLVEEAAERIWAAIEQSHAEAALREREEKFRSLFEAMDEGFAICELVRDSNGRVVDYRYVEVNPAVVRHVGMSPEALHGKLASEIFGDLDPWLLATYARVVDEARSVVTEHHFANVDRWLHINVFPRGGDCIAAVYSDVTDRKRAEQTLRDSEHRQAFLLRFTDAIRSEPNEQALIERAVRMLAEELAVDRAYATRHYPAQDLTHVVHEVRAPGLAPLPATLRFSDFPEAGRQTFERTLVYEDTANDPSLTDADKGALASMGVGALLSRPLRRDGSPIFALGVVSTGPRRWTPAEVALVEEAAERTWEAAERARGEAALRESEEKYAALFAASPAPFLVLGPDAPHFTIADVNGAYLATTMRTRENLVGRPMFDAFPDNPDDPAANGVSNLRASLERALVSGRFELMDVQKYDIARPDGTFEERWWKPANAPVVDADGKVVAIIHHVADVTAEHRAVEGLRESEERLRKVINAETVGIVFFDLEGGISDANDAFLRMIGYSRDALEAGEVRYENLTPPDWRWRDERTIAELRAAGRAGPYEKDYFRRDGSRMRILCSSQLLDPDTAVEFVVDVTEAKRAEDKLRESEQRLRVVADNLPAMIGYYDQDLRYAWINEEYGRFFGVSVESIRGRRLEEWLAPHVFARLKPFLERALAGEHVTLLDREPDKFGPGLHGWTEETFIPHVGDSGKVEGLFALVIDVTERKQAEQALAGSEERFRRFGEASQDILWMRDAGTLQWTYLTPAFEAIYGLSRKEALEGDDYRSWLDLIVPEDRDGVRQAIERVRAGEQAAFEYRIRRPADGRVCWLRETSFAIGDGTGKVAAIGGIAHDVTELREAGERAKLLLAELQHRVRNILAMIRSVVRRTAVTADSVDDYAQHLEGRISAMARTQALLTRGAGAEVDLQDMILDELKMQAAQPGQYVLTGPDVPLAPKAAEVLGLALHELATNAVKYGALSGRDGRIDVRWALLEGERGEGGAAARRLSLIWSESGVRMAGAPAREGFGTELVTQRVPYELQGTGRMEFPPTGLVATIEFPLAERASILATDDGTGKGQGR